MPIVEHPVPDSVERFYSDLSVAFVRVGFYVALVLGTLTCGALTVVDVSPGEVLTSYLPVAGLFLPFVYVYSVLFGTAKREHFPAYSPRPGRFFSRAYGPLGWSGAIVLVVTIWCFVRCTWVVPALPLWLMPAPTLVPLVLGGWLFAGRYRLLSVQRSWETSSPSERHPASLSRAKMFVVPAVLYVLLAIGVPAGAFFWNPPDPERGHVVAATVVMGAALALGAAFLLSDRGQTHGDDPERKYTFENPFVREPFVLLSTVAIPFITGMAVGLHKAGIDVVPSWFISTQSLAITVTLCGVGLVLELMRYLGNYGETYFARVLPAEELPERFGDSVGRYLSIYVFVLSLVPFLLFMSDFLPQVHKLAIPSLLALFILTVSILRPYSNMGFGPSGQPQASSGTPLWRLVSKRLVASIRRPTRRLLLVSVKVIGYVVLLLVLALALKNMQAYPLQVAGQPQADVHHLVSGTTVARHVSEPLYKQLLQARTSIRYGPKAAFLLLGDSVLGQAGASDSWFWLQSLRFSPFHLAQLERDLMQTPALTAGVSEALAKLQQANSERSGPWPQPIQAILVGVLLIALAALISNQVTTSWPVNRSALWAGVIVSAVFAVLACLAALHRPVPPDAESLGTLGTLWHERLMQAAAGRHGWGLFAAYCVYAFSFLVLASIRSPKRSHQ